jgi:N-acetylmuramoyl-L-alanine amidase
MNRAFSFRYLFFLMLLFGPQSVFPYNAIRSPSQSVHTIKSVACEKKQNCVLIAFDLSDSVPLEYAYRFPLITFTFSGATVDTGQIRSAQSVGLVDSFSAEQLKESARVSFRVSREIEEPLIAYRKDHHTVLISLQSKGAESGTEGSDMMGSGIQTIVIDAGHGGMDPGAIGPTGKMEKDLVLGITLALRDLLKKEKGIKVFLTREKDEFVPLSERTKMANKRHADLFISIHANAIPGSQKKKETTRGYKAYFLSQAKNEEDKVAAMRENAVIKLEDRPQHYGALKNVLIDLEGNEYLLESQDLCILLDQQFGALLRKKICRQQQGVGQANFWVLNGAYMPSILIETGYISCPPEEKLLSDPSFQKQIAAAIFEAVKTFKKKYETGL